MSSMLFFSGSDYRRSTRSLISDGNLSTDITFTRASTGTYFDANSVLRTATTNTPRIDYAQDGSGDYGFLREEAATNLLLQSRDFETTWTEGGSGDITFTGGQASLFGDDAALLLTGDADARRVEQTITVTVDTHCVSMLFKPGTTTEPRLRVDNNAVTTSVFFDASDGTTTTEAGSPTNVLFYEIGTTGFWYASFCYAAGATSTIVRIYPRVGSCTFDHVQHEVGTFPTSRIVTTTLAVTRAVDVATIDLTAVTWWNATEGTFYVDYDSDITTAGYLLHAFADTSNFLAIFGSSPDLFGRARISGTITDIGSGGYPDGSRKAAYAFKANDHGFTYDGMSPSLNASIGMPTGLITLEIGTRTGGGGNVSCRIKNLRYYNTRLINALLQGITATEYPAVYTPGVTTVNSPTQPSKPDLET